MEVRGSVPPGQAQAPAPRPYEGVWRFTAPSVETSVPRMRHGVRALIRERGVPVDDDTLYGLMLILSELVTNAVRHAAVLSPEFSVEVAVGAEWIRIAVEDSHPYRPRALETDHARTGGRGLLLVKTLTDEAGGRCEITRTSGGGKIVRAALPLSAPAH
ncbi:MULTISPECIES: ATP-binding protein [unclassified Streptomyces]|uniref:ATP-binding protein n=1 Tax=unclassified Streptomyces TaxID=2593676 RepID=UPI002E27F227|nr:ATP-binding protein [Streptomyces sp. NBC_00223]